MMELHRFGGGVQTGDWIRVPERRLMVGSTEGNRVVRVCSEGSVALGGPLLDSRGKQIGFECQMDGESLAALAPPALAAPGFERVVALEVPPLSDGTHPARWIVPSPKARKAADDGDGRARCDVARESWRGRVHLRQEQDGAPGLRPPQVGAVYGVLAHWTASDGMATVVMPTGTGKTETMLTLLVLERFSRLLVLVPSDALREQIGRKFETLGKLRQLGVLAPGAANPVVGRITRKLKSAEAAQALFGRCNVVVSTVAALSGLPEAVKEVIRTSFDGLFIDEAHHVAATTWTEVRELFASRAAARIVQFTATPFREDGKLVDGKVVFRFPMRRAMEQGYFRKIRYLPIVDGNEDEVDTDIARRAVTQLEQDLGRGFDHVVMARTKNLKRAAEVLNIYMAMAPGHCPVCIHSRLPKTEIERAKAVLLERRTRIIVCVDMLGEGFDFPNLKIAALHDPHRSLAVTLQFVGRFTRDGQGLGEATAIASLADARMDDRIQSLYAEDADWGTLLDDLSEEQTVSSVERSEFLAGFQRGADDLVALRRIFPKMSTTVFRTDTTAWKPHKVEEGLGATRNLRMGPCINEARRVALALTEQSEEVPWGDTKVVANTVWHLFLIHWDEEQRLLFINTSDHQTSLRLLAETVTGGAVEQVESEDVYKAFHGLTRVTLMNVGLKHRSHRYTRFSMLVGPDVAQGMSPTSLAGKSKTNVFVTGRDKGRRVTLGASVKGRIWSYAKARDMSEWVRWCQAIGRKIRDSSVSRETVLHGAMMGGPIDHRPAVMPLMVDWSEDILRCSEETVFLDAGDSDVPLLDANLTPVFNDVADPLRFVLAMGPETREFELQFLAGDQGARFVQTGGTAVFIKVGGKRRLLTEWFNDNPPCITFADLSELEGSLQFATRTPVACSPLRDEDLIAWSWPHPVDITKESHRKHPPTASAVAVQTYALQEIATPAWEAASGFGYEIIFDDDESGEAADIVALGTTADQVRIDLFHCKFSKTSTAGARVGDLYEVCGQSARSVRWIDGPAKLVRHLLARERTALRGKGSRFIKGDQRALRRYESLVGQRHVTFRVFAVQPGLSKAEAEHVQNVRDILASVDTYLRQSAEFGLKVICSP